MNKKSTQIIVAILCFAGSGMVLYYGYFKPQAESKKLPATVPAMGGTAMSGGAGGSMKDEPILPLNKLQEKDLAPIKSINGDSYVDSYPKFNPKTEVGIEVKDLIPPLNKVQQ